MKVFPAEHKDIATDLGQPAFLMLLHEYMSWARAEVRDLPAEESHLQDCGQSGL